MPHSADDENAIRSVMAASDAAILARDADASIVALDGTVVSFDLAPPLATEGAEARDVEAARAWFATWDGPIAWRTDLRRVEVEGDLAAAWGFVYLSGNKIGHGEVEQWSRISLVFRRRGEAWRIVHQHVSVPTQMDGSGKAALDLKPPPNLPPD